MGSNQEILRAVKGGEASMGIVADEDLPAPLESIPLLDDELVVVVARTIRGRGGGYTRRTYLERHSSPGRENRRRIRLSNKL